MHIIGLVGYQGVGKTTYALEAVENMSLGAKAVKMSFADTPRQSVSEQFGIDIDVFYSDNKNKREVHIDSVTPKQRNILFRDGEKNISYRDLMIRWTDWEKSQGDKTIYLRNTKAELEEHLKNGTDFIVFDDLRLFMEYDLLREYSHEIRVLTRKGHYPRTYDEMNSFEREMTRLLKQYGPLFRHIDITIR